MSTTPQERLALGVAALLLAAGVGARALHQGQAPPEWSGPAAEADAAGIAALKGEVAEEVAREEQRKKPLAPGERIDPNTASAEELDRLPKIGPGAAEKIVARRQSHGPFRTLADLDSVSGIGPAALAAIAPHVTLPAGSSSNPRLPSRSRSTTAAASVSPAGGVVDLNAASAAELEALPGVGPGLAARIVADREARGRFRAVDELARVAGIGPAKLEQIRPHARATP